MFFPTNKFFLFFWRVRDGRGGEGGGDDGGRRYYYY